MDREMIDGKAITDGNYLVVDKEAEIFDGDVVVAIVENCATVKRFKKDQDMVVLYPNSSNPIHQPIYLDKNTESMLNGKVIKVLEKPII